MPPHDASRSLRAAAAPRVDSPWRLRTHARVRAGSTLPAVMGILTVVLLISAALADRAVETHRDAWRALDGARLRALAENAMHAAVTSWDRRTAAALATGTGDTLQQITDSTGRIVVSRIRTRANEFVLEARATHPRLHRNADALWRLVRPLRAQWPTMPIPASLTAHGALSVEGRAALSGVDSVSDGWTTECAGDTRSGSIGAVAARSLNITQNVTLTGSPLATALTSAQASQFATAFDAAFAQLQTAATATRTDSVLSFLATDLSTNPCVRLLGDALRAIPATSCQRHWPVVLVTPPLEVRLTGSTPSQGVLLVDGDLKLDAGIRFNGVILVTGRVTSVLASNAPEARMTGGVLVRDRNARGSRVSGPIRVRANQCAVRRALSAAGTPWFARSAAWWEP